MTPTELELARGAIRAVRESATGRGILGPAALRLADAADVLLSENERLRAALTNANDQTEHFERSWYLRGDEIERLRADADRYRWLRDPANANADEWDLFGPYSSPKEVDAAIDAAMKEAK